MKEIVTTAKFLLYMGLMVVILTGCDDDDDDVRNAESLLIGVWSVSDTDFDASVDGQPLATYFVENGGLSAEDANIAVALFEALIKTSLSGTVEFKDDHTFVANFGGDPETGTWELSSDGKTLILDPGGPDEVIMTVNTLTESTLDIDFSQVTFEDLDDDPATPDVEITIDINMELTK
jgi:hypothetical protein